MKQRRNFQLLIALIIFVCFAASAFTANAEEMKRGDSSLLVFKAGIKIGCMEKPTIEQSFPGSKLSTSQVYSTVFICTEDICGDIVVEFGDVQHDYSPECGSSISFYNVPPGTYYFYAVSYDCSTYWENYYTIEEGYNFTIWVCPRTSEQCCASGCGENGSYNCDSCGSGPDIGCLASYVIKDKATLESLRQFRDDTLAKNLIGQKLITLYYHWSPMLTELARKNQLFKELARRTFEYVGKK